jgi:hypothetical protein
MFATNLTARLSSVIYPVMIVAGATWGATGEAGMGLAALAVAVLLCSAGVPAGVFRGQGWRRWFSTGSYTRN